MIKILNVNKTLRDRKAKGPITSSQLFLGKSYSYHPQGLLSEDIFGIYGSPERRINISWINLNCRIIHPVIFDILSKRIERKIVQVLSGEKSFRFDESGALIEDEDGEIVGITSFINNIDKWKMRKSDDIDTDRNKIIRVIEKFIKSGEFFIDKLIVVPPDYRPVQIKEETGEVMSDELNNLYQKIIMLSNQLTHVSGALFDILSYRMQMNLRDLNELVRQRVSKKSGIIRRLMLGNRVDFSARTVITPNPNLELGTTGIPFRIICQIFEPYIIYGLTNSPNSKNIPGEFYEEVKKFLGKETELEIV